MFRVFLVAVLFCFMATAVFADSDYVPYGVKANEAVGESYEGYQRPEGPERGSFHLSVGPGIGIGRHVNFSSMNFKKDRSTFVGLIFAEQYLYQDRIGYAISVGYMEGYGKARPDSFGPEKKYNRLKNTAIGFHIIGKERVGKVERALALGVSYNFNKYERKYADWDETIRVKKTEKIGFLADYFKRYYITDSLTIGYNFRYAYHKFEGGSSPHMYNIHIMAGFSYRKSGRWLQKVIDVSYMK